MFWTVDDNGHVFPTREGMAEHEVPHVIVDRTGVEWTARVVPTPQTWARAAECLVLNSRECVRRVWHFPKSWRSLDADVLLRLGTRD